MCTSSAPTIHSTLSVDQRVILSSPSVDTRGKFRVENGDRSRAVPDNDASGTLMLAIDRNPLA